MRTQKLGEADRIVTLLLRRRGLLRAVAKGVRRTSSKFGARLEPFMVADLQCYEGRTLDTITQAVTLAPYGPRISVDYERYRSACVVAETAERLAEGVPSPEQYGLLVGALRTLSVGQIPAELVRDSYLLRSLGIAGWSPGFIDCVSCGAAGPHTAVAVQLGGVTCETCRVPGSPRLDPESVALLAALAAGDWPVALESAERARNQAAGIASAYTQFHLERGLRSLTTPRQ